MTSTDLEHLKDVATRLVGAGFYAMILLTRDLWRTYMIQQMIHWLGDLPARYRTKTLLDLDACVQLDLIISKIICEQLFMENDDARGTELETKMDIVEKSDSELWKPFNGDRKLKTRLNSLILLNYKLFHRQRYVIYECNKPLKDADPLVLESSFHRVSRIQVRLYSCSISHYFKNFVDSL
jgi:hypothetical protein